MFLVFFGNIFLLRYQFVYSQVGSFGVFFHCQNVKKVPIPIKDLYKLVLYMISWEICGDHACQSENSIIVWKVYFSDIRNLFLWNCSGKPISNISVDFLELNLKNGTSSKQSNLTIFFIIKKVSRRTDLCCETCDHAGLKFASFYKTKIFFPQIAHFGNISYLCAFFPEYWH